MRITVKPDAVLSVDSTLRIGTAKRSGPNRDGPNYTLDSGREAVVVDTGKRDANGNPITVLAYVQLTVTVKAEGLTADQRAALEGGQIRQPAQAA